MTRAARAPYALILVAALVCAHLPTARSSAPPPHATPRTAPATDLRLGTDLGTFPLGVLTGDRVRESRSFTRTTLDGVHPTPKSIPALTRGGRAPRGIAVPLAPGATVTVSPRGPPASPPLRNS